MTASQRFIYIDPIIVWHAAQYDEGVGVEAMAEQLGRGPAQVAICVKHGREKGVLARVVGSGIDDNLRFTVTPAGHEWLEEAVEEYLDAKENADGTWTYELKVRSKVESMTSEPLTMRKKGGAPVMPLRPRDVIEMVSPTPELAGLPQPDDDGS